MYTGPHPGGFAPPCKGGWGDSSFCFYRYNVGMNTRKKAKPKRASKPKIRKTESGAQKKPKLKTPSTAKEQEELIRIWDEDLCE